MRPVLTCLFATVLLLSSLTPPLLAQGRQRTLLVSATTDTGAPVQQLTPDDVVVREDGVAREILKVSRATAPVQIVILVDNSQAATRAIQDIRLGLDAFVNEFAGPHEISLVAVADRPTVLVGPTTSKAALERGIDRIFARPDAGAYTVQGIIEQAQAIEKREPVRAAILAISSLGIEFSDRGYQAATDALAESGASLYVIELQDTVEAGPLTQGTRDRNIVFDRGVSDSGGTRDILLANLSLRDALMKMGHVITTQYQVVYGRPDTLIPARKVAVDSARPGVKLRGNVLRANREGR